MVMNHTATAIIIVTTSTWTTFGCEFLICRCITSMKPCAGTICLSDVENYHFNEQPISLVGLANGNRAGCWQILPLGNFTNVFCGRPVTRIEWHPAYSYGWWLIISHYSHSYIRSSYDAYQLVYLLSLYWRLHHTYYCRNQLSVTRVCLKMEQTWPVFFNGEIVLL